LSALFVTMTLVGCASSRVEVKKEQGGRARQWALLCQDSAMMSALAYRNNPPAELNEKLREYERKLNGSGWYRRGSINRTEGDGRGLYFEVWQNDQRQPRRICFSFRGTHGGADWGANLRWFRVVTHGRGDHYEAARAECIGLIYKFEKEAHGRKVVFSTTGHSLGGGLAQHVLYAAPHKIDHCVAFDSSPVTGYKDYGREQRKFYASQLNRAEFSQYRILRAYERGEILMFARNLSAAVYKPDTNTRSIEFDSPGGFTAIGKHSMTLLADTINKLAEQPPERLTPPKLALPTLQPGSA
jgi:pimeloyl-ACP methyl ester carboxylesterase